MSRYRPVKKANVYMYSSKNLKKVFYGMRTLYAKDHTGKVYVRYKNRYYRAYYDGRYTYNVRL